MPTVWYERKGTVAVITLNRPEVLNAVNPEMYEELGETWERFVADDDAWVAILRGEGRAFCAGHDLKAPPSTQADNLRDLRRAMPPSFTNSNPTVDHRIWKPIIAALHGYVLGTGFIFSTYCDLRVAAEGTMLGTPEAKRGWGTPYISHIWRIIGMTGAMELACGLMIDAQRMYHLNYLNKVVPQDRLMEEAMQLAESISESAPIAVRRHKEVMHLTWGLPAREREALEHHIFESLRHTGEAEEGRRAFMEKRPPVWKPK